MNFIRVQELILLRQYTVLTYSYSAKQMTQWWGSP